MVDAAGIATPVLPSVAAVHVPVGMCECHIVEQGLGWRSGAVHSELSKLALRDCYLVLAELALSRSGLCWPC